jgi:hypothetical protein
MDKTNGEKRALKAPTLMEYGTLREITENHYKVKTAETRPSAGHCDHNDFDSLTELPRRKQRLIQTRTEDLPKSGRAY